MSTTESTNFENSNYARVANDGGQSHSQPETDRILDDGAAYYVIVLNQGYIRGTSPGILRRVWVPE